MGYRTIPMPAGSGSDIEGQTVTRQYAENELFVLSSTLNSHGPAVVVHSDMSSGIYMDEDAIEALKEIDELKAMAASNASDPRSEEDWLLKEEARDQILAFARGHRGKL
jgi:hypothetical protein